MSGTDSPRNHGFWWVKKTKGAQWSMVEVHGWGVTLGNPDLQDHIDPDHERIKDWEWGPYMGTQPVNTRSPEERLEAAAQMSEDFCIYCGGDHTSYGRCQCWNDE